MSQAALHFLDWFFVVFHWSLVAFNLTGWIWRRTVKAQLMTLGLTFLSWFGLGIVYGWGYCPCTDWHWDVKRQLGETGLPASYVKYYLDFVTGLSWDPFVVDVLVVGSAVVALGLGVWRIVKPLLNAGARN